MNGRQRVQATIARKPVDRVPLGFYAVDHDIVSKVLGRPTYVRNKIGLWLALAEGRRDEVAEGLKRDTVAFYRKIDCADLLLPKEAQRLPPKDYRPDPLKKIGDNVWQDKAGRVFKAVPDCNEVQCIADPARGLHEYTAADFEKPVPLRGVDPSCFEVFDHVYAELGEERYIAAMSGGGGLLPMPGGVEQGMMMYALQPDVILAAQAQAIDAANARDAYTIRCSAPGALIEKDMAGTNGPLVSPGMFREMVLPSLKRRVESIKRHAPQVIFHNCGNNIPLMEMFIEAGIDCYQSLQTTAGMEIGKLKEMVGGRMTFWGGVAVETLIQGTPDDVRTAVRVALERGAPGGGFILGPSHSIAMNTRYENFMALCDEFVKLRDKY